MILRIYQVFSVSVQWGVVATLLQRNRFGYVAVTGRCGYVTCNVTVIGPTLQLRNRYQLRCCNGALWLRYCNVTVTSYVPVT